MTLAPPSGDVLEIVTRAERSLRSLEGSRLLVTGGAGFLGSYICHALALANDTLFKQRCTISCVDTFVTGSSDRIAELRSRPDFRFNEGSAVDIHESDSDFIVHAASIASPPMYRQLPLETVEANVLGTWNMLRLAKEGCRSFLYLSSSEVYGDPEDAAIPTREDYVGRVSFTGPRACYDESKRLAETLCRLFFERHAVPVKVARPFNVYGPGLRLDDGRLVPDLIRQALAGPELVLHSDGTPTRSFCYVTDAIAAFFGLLACDADGEAFNVGVPHEISVWELAQKLAALTGGRAVTSRPSEDSRYLTDNPSRRLPDIEKIQRAIDWRPLVSLDEGLSRTVRSYGERA
ncbi:MAG: NAD-dependent epimerase/dehydratase family protein [Chloroflexota bacterium]|nr:NAD-dependent epimerase/dehydratase family protein [Chloroflexota bacterium]